MGKAGKIAATVTTVLAATLVTVGVEAGTYVLTGGGFNPVDGATVAAFAYFDEFVADEAVRQRDSHRAVGKFLEDRTFGGNCHLVYTYSVTTVPLIGKKIANKTYTYHHSDVKIPNTGGCKVLYDYDAARQYLKDAREERKKANELDKTPADLTLRN